MSLETFALQTSKADFWKGAHSPGFHEPDQESCFGLSSLPFLAASQTADPYTESTSVCTLPELGCSKSSGLLSFSRFQLLLSSTRSPSRLPKSASTMAQDSLQPGPLIWDKNKAIYLNKW